MLVVPGLWLLWRWTSGHFLVTSPLDGALLVFWLMVLVSVFATYDVAVSLPKISGLVFGLGVYGATARSTSQPHGWRWPLLIFLLGGAGIALVGLLGMPDTPKLEMLHSLFRLASLGALQPNEVAGALVWVIPVSLGLLVCHFRERPRLLAEFGAGGWLLFLLLLGVLNSLLLGTLLLTQSRSSYIGLALAMLCVISLTLPFRWRWVTVGLVTLAALAVILVFGPTLAPALESVLDGRLEIWARAVYALQDYPFSGLGLNTFRYLVQILYPLAVIGPVQDIGHAHNEFLQAGLDLGLAGLIAWIALYLGAAAMLRSIGKHAHFRLDLKRNRQFGLNPNYLTMGLAAGLVAHLLFGLTDAVALGAKPGILFWMLLGLIVGIYRQAALRPIAVKE